MADGSSSVDFTVRLLNQVTGPARQIQTAMAGVRDTMKSTKRALEAPCTCVVLEGGITIADGCAKHDAKGAKVAQEEEPRRMSA